MATDLQAALELERAVLRRVVERVPAGICLLWGAELEIRLVNQSFYDLVPDRGGAVGRTLDEYFPELSAGPARYVARTFERRGLVELSEEAIKFDGEASERYYDATLMPIDDAPGHVGGVLVTFREVTEQVAARRALEQELTEEHHIADTLQRSLMPDALPQVDGVELAAIYQPAGERHRVGGDFYEVFRAGDSLVIILGDVVGKGPAAAAVTARVRHTAKALALYERRASDFLARLDQILRDSPDASSICTAVCAVIEDLGDRSRALVASAGHPRPLLARGRDVHEVGASNPALGLAREPGFSEREIDLEVGDRLLLYSDGLTDANAPARVIPVAELRAQMTARRDDPLNRLVDEIVEWSCGDVDSARDDIAVLAVERTA
ncbi:SpoIIE family protein phosphatase [Thermoleophilia bacterium SCSIO 60948]|nr:SpoIIE family protein phosphatase [Thermoleophilia bacterium SCSIO 60948]